MYKGVKFHHYATIYLMGKGLLELRNVERGAKSILPFFFLKKKRNI